MSSILDYPDTNAMHPPSRAHELILWLSMDGLTDYWQTFPQIAAEMPAAKAAACSAITAFHDSGQSAPHVFTAHLPDGEAHPAALFVHKSEAMEQDQGVSYWQGWASEAQNDPNMTGLEPAVGMELMKLYKKTCTKPVRKIMDDLRGALAATPLSDWDMELHTIYGYCTYETGRFGESVLLGGLRRLSANWLFQGWIRNHVATLPPGDQLALYTAVRDTWQDTLEEPLESEMEQALLGVDNIGAELDRIPMPRDVLV